MKAPSLEMIGFTIRLTLARFGWSNGIACILCVAGIGAWGWGVPHLQAQLKNQRQLLADAQQALLSAETATPIVARSPAEEHLAHFYESLGEQAIVEQQIKTLFAIANKVNLTLSQAEYKSAYVRNGFYNTYQILMPVKGPYGALRQFCEQTLLAIPFASLDEMDFKRDAIASNIVEVKVRFTLYLADAPSYPRQTAQNDSSAAALAYTAGQSGSAKHDATILRLKSRDTFIGESDKHRQGAHPLFTSQTWTPPPPPPSKPLPPPPPTAPSLPFTYLGKKIEDGVWEIYLARGEHTFIVREKSVIDGTYRIDSIKPPALTLTYLPLNQSQALTIGGID